MERCPNCGTPARQDANFCTTCGFRFSGDIDSDNVQMIDATDPAGDVDIESTTSKTVAGWPSAPGPRSTVYDGWEPKPDVASLAAAEANEPTADDASSFWSEATPDPWPAPPPANVVDPNSIVAPREEIREIDPGVQRFTATTTTQVDTKEALARAQTLLDELRVVLGTVAGESALDLSGVISDLEVAVTPPGALPPGDVTELREALLAARERPRDVDTIVDLTKRIEAMVSLVIAYDRTIAAIERSLDVLRLSEIPSPHALQPTVADGELNGARTPIEEQKSPSPVEPGEGLG